MNNGNNRGNNRNVPARQQQQAPAQQRQPQTMQQMPQEAVLKRDIHLDSNLFRALFAGDETRANRFMAEAFAAIRRNPDLVKADRRSLILALGEAAVLDLSVDPVLGECWLIPRYDKNFGCQVVNFQTGARGLIKLMHRGSAPIDWIVARVVRRGEHFREIAGSDPKVEHEIPLDADVDESDAGIIGAYCAVMLRGSTRAITRVVRRSKLEEAAEKSGKPGTKEWSTIWKQHFEEMAIKTAIRRVAKHVPGADDARVALWREDERESGRQPPVFDQLRAVAGAALPSAPRQDGNSLDALVERKQQADRAELPSAHPDAEPPWDDLPPEEPPQ